MSPESRQIAYANDEVDELAEFSVEIAKGALERRRETCATIRCAAEFQCKIGDRVDFEEGTGDMKEKPKRQCGSKESEGYDNGVARSTVEKTLCWCSSCKKAKYPW